MNKKSAIIAVIVEGEKREIKYFENLKRCFFPNKDVKILTLSAGENIYMLWKQMNKDDFETDIIEVLRENSPLASRGLDGLKRTDFQEIYLFFDYEAQQNNLGNKDKPADEVILEMLDKFDNETENGKLYISYPMCEALRDIRDKDCKAFTECFVKVELLHDYKRASGESNDYADVSMYTLERWIMIINIFLARLKCLFSVQVEKDELLKWYKDRINVGEIFKKEKTEHTERKRIFVLSAFPEFLIDYFTSTDILNLLSGFEIVSQSQCNLKNK